MWDNLLVLVMMIWMVDDIQQWPIMLVHVNGRSVPRSKRRGGPNMVQIHNEDESMHVRSETKLYTPIG